jgi:hypothetical protein
MTTRRIDIGERHRRDLGDIASLAANVAELGLYLGDTSPSARRTESGKEAPDEQT